MRSVRRWVFAAALAAVGTWLYVIAGSGAELLTLLGRLDEASVVEPMPLESATNERPAQHRRPEALAGESGPETLPQAISTDDLSGAQIMRLLEDEIAFDTDPTAADEFLRAFGESLDTPGQ